MTKATLLVPYVPSLSIWAARSSLDHSWPPIARAITCGVWLDMTENARALLLLHLAHFRLAHILRCSHPALRARTGARKAQERVFGNALHQVLSFNLPTHTICIFMAFSLLKLCCYVVHSNIVPPPRTYTPTRLPTASSLIFNTKSIQQSIRVRIANSFTSKLARPSLTNLHRLSKAALSESLSSYLF